MAEVYHLKGEGRVRKGRFKRSVTECVGNDFRLVFRPVTVIRAGLSGSSEKGVDPLTGKLVSLGNPIMLPESRFQLNVVVVEDAITGESMDVVDDQAQGHKVIGLIRNKRRPKLNPITPKLLTEVKRA